ncbi:MAG: sigma-70 family RNA polymerase sigma factor [Clostridia bacterium]|nr:sigma-70 family RNA polymerase sigma factor [Clostridia bacterium]
MDDNRIIALLFERAETALDEVSRKYSRLYKGILREVVSDACDVEECANDVLLAVWNTIPPNRPNSLSSYLCKIARNIGINRFKYNTRAKRSCGYTVMLSELEDCLPAEASLDDSDAYSESIRLVLSDFIRSLDPETEILFVRRYLYLESVNELSKRFGLSENRISVKLYRARKKLKKVLEKEGIKL